MKDINFELIKEIFSIINYEIYSYEDLNDLTISNSYLRNTEFNKKTKEKILERYFVIKEID